MKNYQQSHQSIDEFMIDFIDKYDLKPKTIEVVEEPARISFIIHALNQDQLWNADYTKALRKSPQLVKDTLEKAFSKAPVLPYGRITGIKSQSTGKEVIVDLYALPATPKTLLKMRDETVYRQLVKAINHSAEKGSLLSGLGAYTKVVGDAGVTVNRRSNIPVTTGNSYSTASTLWAAAEMIAKMGFLKTMDDGSIDGKAMIIGASGSIGRVCALKIAMTYSEITLVAPRIEKLLELKSEIEERFPKTVVNVSKSADRYAKIWI